MGNNSLSDLSGMIPGHLVIDMCAPPPQTDFFKCMPTAVYIWYKVAARTFLFPRSGVSLVAYAKTLPTSNWHYMERDKERQKGSFKHSQQYKYRLILNVIKGRLYNRNNLFLKYISHTTYRILLLIT